MNLVDFHSHLRPFLTRKFFQEILDTVTMSFGTFGTGAIVLRADYTPYDTLTGGFK